MSVLSESVECIECEGTIMPGEDESTFCGSVHEGECHSNHLRHCRVCGCDGEYEEDDSV